MQKVHDRSDQVSRIARGLGWFSIGLGAAELLAPGALARFIGVRDRAGTRALLRFYGLREIGAGIGILTQRQQAPWLWGRVAGDAVDLASLGVAMNSDRNSKARLGFATASVAGVTALDVYCGQQMSGAGNDGHVQASKTVMIDRSPEEVYQFWRKLDNLPQFMRHVESVRVISDRLTHWTVNGPAGKSFEWDAEIVEDRPNSMISWRSRAGADIDNSGIVWFDRAPGDRGTLVRVEIDYAPPAGRMGAMLAKLFGKEPGQQLDDDLRAFKSILETGEVVKSDASIHRGMHPAQPSEPTEETDTAHEPSRSAPNPRLMPV